ncbi:MAG: acetyl-CoA hydrolase/transferase C-terminal domain-containing protein [Chitinophagales bacterium]
MVDSPVKIYDDVKKCVDDVIEKVGKNIVFAMPLALGKPVMFVNELYRRAKEDPSISLKIITALPLEVPRGKSDLEKRVTKDIAQRLFDGVPDLNYMLDFRACTMPKNVESYEFFSQAGTYLGNPTAQQNHIASNYTHIVRDALDLGVNVFGNLIGYLETDGKTLYSMGCNTDICIEGLKEVAIRRARGEKMCIVGEANQNMPFMYGDGVVEPDVYDCILRGPDFDYQIFGVPKPAVSVADYMIGLNVSPLIKDGGTLQVGIGALGDAIVAGLAVRNNHNEVYQDVLKKAGIIKRYEKLINKIGGTGVFEEGLYGSSEMFVDAFMELYKSNILKRQVFDSIPLMKLINEGDLKADKIPADIIDRLLNMNAIQPILTLEDFNFLTEYGVLRKDLKYEDGRIFDGDVSYSADLNDLNNRQEIRKLLGTKLRNGKVVIGAFFVGPRGFYKWLNEMEEEERQLFGMSGVEKVNQLYGDEELRTLQRKDGRFVNTGMVCTLLGSIASDMLEDGQVVSGIGGQYNFVSMGHALRDARVIMMIKSTKGMGRKLKSNIVFSYGHCSVPKHLRDIIVTEYGIADVRGKAEKDVIAEILNITDSRFQKQLLEQAKKAAKIPMDYEIPVEYTNNTPEKLKALLAPYKAKGYFPSYPFGTDFSQDDIDLMGALKGFQAMAKGYPGKVVKGLLAELFRSIPPAANRHLERMELNKPSSVKEKLFRKIVVLALRTSGYIDKAASSVQPSKGVTA